MWPKNVYWSKTRAAAAGRGGAAQGPMLPFTESDLMYGKVYHTGNADATCSNC